jgi:exopolyphosphatase/guanosine-5'-triphosphate,3'-diphosphate pyrophosphatase
MRDAKNRDEVVRKIYLETGISIKVITGDFEASLIYENHIAENLNENNNYLYIDVGGGSTELTFFANNELVFKQSFNIGTIRLLKGLTNENIWDELKDSIRDKIKGQKNIVAIGTGGNINKIFSMSKKKEGKPLDIELLKDYYKEFSSFTLEERIRVYNLREDRADVIVPALLIYIQVMKWADINEILVPKIGLADGLIQHLYAEMAG